jgi:hypothetical protein
VLSVTRPSFGVDVDVAGYVGHPEIQGNSMFPLSVIGFAELSAGRA